MHAIILLGNMKKRQKTNLYLLTLVVFLVAFAVWALVAREKSFTSDSVTESSVDAEQVQNLDTVENQKSETKSESESSGTALEAKPEVLPSLPKAPDRLSTENDAGLNVDLQVFAVSFDGLKFEPSTLEIKKGDIVSFTNDSSGPFWPASGPHPTHTNYPEFDAKKKLLPGESFEFQFTKVGKWSFHDHLLPSASGTIVVSE